MKKGMKRVLAVVLVLAIAGGCGFGGWRIYQNYHSGAVEVYSIDNLSTTYWGDETQTEGFVTTDQLQSEYLSDTQTVEDIKVKKGQKVKKGDVLFTYDSTLSDLDLKRKNLELQQKTLDLNNARKELKVIRTYRAGVPIPGSSSGGGGGFSMPSNPQDESIPTYDGLFLVYGKGTQKQPYCYMWKDGFQFTDELLAAAMQGKDDAYVTFYLTGQDISLPAPVDPDEPDDPDNPDNPDTPDNPDNPDNPDTPDNPNNPDNPDTPDDPDNPDNPDTPDDPDNPDIPDEPDTPDDPTPPDEPDTPDTPEVPGDVSGEDTPDASQLRSSLSQGTVMRLSTVPAKSTGNTSDPDDTSNTGDTGSEEEEEALYSTAWTMHCQHTNTGYRYVMTSITVGGVERIVSEPLPALTKDELPDSGSDDWSDWDDGGVDGIVYTGAEIAAMLRETQQSIKTMELEYRQLQLESKKLERELNNSEVYSELDGVVTLLNDPEDLDSTTPLLKVSSGGGYVVKGTLSELDLESVQPGQEVSVNSWTTGESCTGAIQSISDYPTINNGYWGEGNTNVSYYSFTVRVDESANLQENDYVDMSYTSNTGSGGSQNIYLLKSFVRSEDGKSYVYVDNNGTLEKRYVSTGRDLWGSYVEIRSDLSDVTSLAFPYGQKVREHAPTVEGSMDSLYSY